MQDKQTSGCRSKLGCLLRALLFIAIGFGIGAFAVSHGLSCEGVLAADSWVSPTSNTANGWANPANAYDDSTTTYSQYTLSLYAWSPYLVLYPADYIICSKVRIYSTREDTSISTISVDVYYDGTWDNIYEGSLTVGAFVEYSIGSEQLVNGLRVKYKTSGAIARWARVHEADFWGDWPADQVIMTPTYSTCVTGYTSSIVACCYNRLACCVVGVSAEWSISEGCGVIEDSDSATDSYGRAEVIVSCNHSCNCTIECLLQGEFEPYGECLETAFIEWLETVDPAPEPAAIDLYPLYDTAVVGSNGSMVALIYYADGRGGISEYVEWSLNDTCGYFIQADNMTNSWGQAEAVIGFNGTGSLLVSAEAIGYELSDDVEVTIIGCSNITMEDVEEFVTAWADLNNVIMGGIGMPLWYLFGLAALAAGAWFSKSMMVNIMVMLMAAAGFPLVTAELEAGTATYWGITTVLILAVIYSLIQLFTRVEHW